MNDHLDIITSYYNCLNKIASEVNEDLLTATEQYLKLQSNRDNVNYRSRAKLMIVANLLQFYYNDIANPEENNELVNELGESLAIIARDALSPPPHVKISTAKGKYDHINFKPPKSVADAAARGLEARRKAPKSQKGGLSPQEAKRQGIGSGVTRAVNLKNRDTLSPSTIKRMFSFFSRHERNKGTPRGRIAWLLWGGDPGFAFARKVIRQMNAADKKSKKKSKK